MKTFMNESRFLPLVLVNTLFVAGCYPSLVQQVYPGQRLPDSEGAIFTHKGSGCPIVMSVWEIDGKPIKDCIADTFTKCTLYLKPGEHTVRIEKRRFRFTAEPGHSYTSTCVDTKQSSHTTPNPILGTGSTQTTYYEFTLVIVDDDSKKVVNQR